MKSLFRLVNFCILFLFTHVIFAQVIKDNWLRIYVKNDIQIDIPPTLEIQSGTYRQMMNSVYNKLNFDEDELVCQEKGLNEFQKGKYARVMINIDRGSIGDYEKANSKINILNQEEINTIKRQMETDGAAYNMRIVKWLGVTMKKINGYTCVHFSYIRQLANKPHVLVNMYLFHNNDECYRLTLSYRTSETDYWKSDFENILNSFKIKEIH